jgi:hypothetical protein
MATIEEIKKGLVDFSSFAARAPYPHFIRTSESFMRTNAAFMSTNPSLMRTNAAFVLVSQLTRPLSITPLMHTNESFMRTNASFALTSHLIDPKLLKRCRSCQRLLSSTESITAPHRGKTNNRRRVLLRHDFLAIPLVNHPGLHYKAHLAHHRNVVQRIARDGD